MPFNAAPEKEDILYDDLYYKGRQGSFPLLVVSTPPNLQNEAKNETILRPKANFCSFTKLQVGTGGTGI